MVPCVSMAGAHVVIFVFIVGLKVSVGQDVEDPCNVHQVLDEEWRNPEAGADPTHCDNMPAGWYAFRIAKQPAMVPTLCLQDHTCGAKVPLRVDLGGQSAPDVGENVTAWLCGSYNVLGAIDCCVQRQPVTIKRCGDDVYVYRLKPQRVCPVAVCAKPVGNQIPGDFMAKPGDTPRSLLSSTPFPEICPEGQPECPDGTCGPCPPTESPTPAVLTTAPTTAQEIVRPLVPIAQDTSPSWRDDSTSFLPSAPVFPDDAGNPANSSSVSSSNDTLDGSADAAHTSPSVHEQGSSGENVTDMAPHWDQPSDDDNMAFLPDNVTSGYNASDVKSDDAATSEPKRSPMTMPMTTDSSSDVKDLSTTKGASGVPDQGSEDDASTVWIQTSTPGMLSEAVRFVLNGTYEEAQFRDALLLFVNNVSRQLTDGNVEEGGLHNMTLMAQTSFPDNITVVDVLVADPSTNGTIPAQRFVTIIQNDNFADLLLAEAGQNLITVCPSVDRCDEGVGRSGGDGHRSQSLFDRNRGVFIAVIVVAAVCLLALLLGLLIVRYRRRGVWVLAPDREEKCADPLAIENPMTDHQILHSEGREPETALAVNGDHHTYASNAADNGHDIPAADEDNGWVVPLDQAPAHGLAEKTEDTQF